MIDQIQDAALHAVALINEAGFRARITSVGDRFSIQVVVKPGDERVFWHQAIIHSRVICTQFASPTTVVWSPVGFYFNIVDDKVYLSQPIERPVDALVFAHCFRDLQPVSGPLGLNKPDLAELGERLLASAPEFIVSVT